MGKKKMMITDVVPEETPETEIPVIGEVKTELEVKPDEPDKSLFITPTIRNSDGELVAG